MVEGCVVAFPRNGPGPRPTRVLQDDKAERCVLGSPRSIKIGIRLHRGCSAHISNTTRYGCGCRGHDGTTASVKSLFTFHSVNFRVFIREVSEQCSTAPFVFSTSPIPLHLGLGLRSRSCPRRLPPCPLGLGPHSSVSTTHHPGPPPTPVHGVHLRCAPAQFSRRCLYTAVALWAGRAHARAGTVLACARGTGL